MAARTAREVAIIVTVPDRQTSGPDEIIFLQLGITASVRRAKLCRRAKIFGG